MRILLVNDYGAPAGGAELQILALRDGLRARGHHARLLSSTALYSDAAPVAADVTCWGTTGRLQPLLMRWNPMAVAAIRDEVEQFRPDIAHVGLFRWQLSPAALAELCARVPVVLVAHMFDAVCPLGRKLLPDGSPCRDTAGPACRANGCLSWRAAPLLLDAHRMTRELWPRLARRVAVSAWLRARIEAEGLPVDAVIPNGVPLPSPAQDSPAPLAEHPKVVCAARLVPEKGVEQLVRAFDAVAARHPDATLWIAGDGPERPAVEAAAARCSASARIHFLGFLPPATLDAAFRGAWVQVVPSLWEEPFGLVLAEAMMRGTAVLAPDHGAAAEILVDGVTGHLYCHRNQDALITLLDRMLMDRAAAARMGEAGRMCARAEFSQDAMVECYLSVYREVTGGP